MTLVMDVIEKGDINMQELMRIGDKFVLADKDIKDIVSASTEITDVAKKYKTDVLAIIGKGSHQITTRRTEYKHTQLKQDLAKIVSLIETVANAYNADAIDVADAVKLIIDKG